MSALLQDISLIGDDIPWLKELRASGRAAFARQGIPTAKTEAWKYTKPNRFLPADFSLYPQGAGAVVPSGVTLPFDAYRICFNSGVFSPAESLLPDGVEVVPLIEAIMFRPDLRSKIGALADIDKHPFAALNAAYLAEGVYIHIDSKVSLNKPLALIYHTSAGDKAPVCHLRNLIMLDAESSAVVVEYFTYNGAPKSSYLTNVVNEVYLAPDSALRHYKLQDEAFKAGHLSLTVAEVNSGALYKSFCLQKGADLARNETKVILAGQGAKAEVDAAYIMNGWATLDTTTDIKHLKPATCSSQLVKGVIGGQAKGVFQGRIHIAPDAVKTEGYQLHKAMLLSDEAEIDVKPELEIFADDVKCSHGAASGRLDPDQLFYMCSRGIGLDEAKQMLVDAYLNDVIAKVDNEKIQDWIKLSVRINEHTAEFQGTENV